MALAPAAALLMGVGGAVSAYGMIQQGRAANREAQYEAATQENNAVASGYAAVQEQQNAAREADSIRDQRIRALSSQRSAAAASGLAISGSVVDVMQDSAIEAEKEIQMSLYRGNVAAYNQRQQGVNYRQQATLTRMAGKNAKRSANIQAGATLLTSAGNAGLSYASFKK